ncbi:ABC transporter permease subunit [Oceanirhabdus seepicola]|uniref:ABC transporter permease subunit n=1 Tax=Oceanirhabdus seepicola TaxID=2828781 RepID=A0A9J6P1L2_9CLOT|nr:ABC transporter permease subunit [Oceanirhabdus seepicola]MCM1989929.1 ABC transporter permease subunit [Oceanirhabdus seepicola]
MGAIIKNELIRIIHDKKIYIFMGILAVIAIVTAVGLEGLGKVAEKTMENGSSSQVMGEEVSVEIALMNTQNYPRILLGFVIDFVLPVMIVVLLAEIITGDIADGKMRYTLVGPISRWKIILGKSMAVMTIIMFLMGFMLIISYISGNVFMKSGMYATENGTLQGVSAVLHTLGVYLKSYMVLAIFTVTFTPICLLLKKRTSMIMVSVAIIIGSTFVQFLWKDVSKYIITTYFKAFTSMVSRSIRIEEGIIFFVYVVISVILTVVVFNRKEVTE